MLSSLPTELIREIIESAVPHSFHSTTYRERQRTLCSLSLVSKLFRSIAQPLLLEIVWIRSTSELDQLPIAGASRIGKEGRGVQYAVVESNSMDGSLLPSVGDAILQRALRLLHLVTTLTASGLYGVALDLCVFEDFSNLKHLHLSGHAWSCSRTPVLPKIESLTLNFLSFETFEALLSRTTFPNLKQFALEDTDSAYLEALERSKFRQLLPQLEVLSFHVSVWLDPRAAFLHPAASRTLVDCETFDLGDLSTQGPPIVNLRICDRLEDVAITGIQPFCVAVDDYADFITSNPALPLQRVYMDSSSQLFSDLPDQLELSIRNFWRTCQERQVDLIFDPVPSDCDFDPCLSLDFSRRMRIAENV